MQSLQWCHRGSFPSCFVGLVLWCWLKGKTILHSGDAVNSENWRAWQHLRFIPLDDWWEETECLLSYCTRRGYLRNVKDDCFEEELIYYHKQHGQPKPVFIQIWLLLTDWIREKKNSEKVFFIQFIILTKTTRKVWQWVILHPNPRWLIYIYLLDWVQISRYIKSVLTKTSNLPLLCEF